MRTILVVDDQHGIRAFYKEALRMLGFSVVTAEHGMEALKICSGRPEPFDLAILDWIMPVLSGDQTKKHLEEKYPGMPIIIASGSVDPSEVPLKSNQVFLNKPFTIDKLKEVIHAILP